MVTEAGGNRSYSRKLSFAGMLFLCAIITLLTISIGALVSRASSLQKQRLNKTLYRLRELTLVLENYSKTKGRYPVNAAELAQHSLEFVGDQSCMIDAWGKQVIYRADGNTVAPKIYSLGANGVDEKGTGDDVSLLRPPGELDATYSRGHAGWLVVPILFIVAILFLAIKIATFLVGQCRVKPSTDPEEKK